MVVGEKSLAGATCKEGLEDVKKCPGVVRRHGPCGELSFIGHKCDSPLCPWCQARRSRKLLVRVAPLIEAMVERKFWTFSPPNLEHLTGDAITALGQVLTQLRRLTFLTGSLGKDGLPYRSRVVRGGIRSIEVTISGRGKGVNLHAHEAVDARWVAQYPQTDITWEPARWVAKRSWEAGESKIKPFARTDIVRKQGTWKAVVSHPGLAREFTCVCQQYPELAKLGVKGGDKLYQWGGGKLHH